MRIAHPSCYLLSAAAATRICHSFSPKPPLSRLLQHQTLTSSQILAPGRSRSLLLNPSMADAEDLSTISAEEDANYGFKRNEMYSSNLAGTVDPYDRHVFLCFKSPDAWGSRVEEDLLPKLLSSAVKSRKGDITIKTKITVCEGGESDGDVLIFPEMIRYKGLKDSDVDSFVEEVLVSGKPWASGLQEVLTGSYIFVCAHGSRDKRCGVCGPALIEKLKQEIEVRGLADQVFVKPCSHVGGHKYAGNVIIFSPDSEGKVMGHWYGYVSTDDVSELLDQHIGKGEIIKRFWRGQLGSSCKEDEKVEEQRLPNGGDVKKQEKQEEINDQENKDIAGSCCQGAIGVSCCRVESSEASEKKEKGLCGMSSWIGSLEQSDILAAGAVVGAAATIAVAYSVYRRSG